MLINKYHYGGIKNPLFAPVAFILRFFAFFYFIVICAKNFLYNKNILKEKKCDPFVICVGNLTTGGVGKTPLVCELANYCSNVLGKKTAIISRGYGAKLNNKKVNVIKNESEILFDDGKICGDEPLMIAKKTNGAIVLTCKDRVRATNFAKENFGCEIVILDDGFSNRTIKKDVTILAIDSKKLFGNKLTLPAGPLREPVWQVKRADFIAIINKEQKNITNLKENILKFANKENGIICNFCEDKFYYIKDGKKFTPNTDKIGAFCAIGQPEQFYQFLHKKFDLAFTKSFADHHKYTQKDILELENLTRKNGTKTLITTQKDEVKIQELIKESNINFVAFELKIDFENDKLYNYIKKELEKYETERNLQQ